MKLIIWLLLTLPGIALAYGSGPDNGYTDAPGESNCTACHDSHPLNSGNGSFLLSGPASFMPGQTYPITVTLQDPGQSRWGFELTTLGVGSCTVTDAVHTQLSEEFGNEYVKHTRSGSYAGVADGPVSWSFNWTAPAAPTASVTLYAAGNAADGSEEPSGDFIYSTALTLQAALSPVTDLQIVALSTGVQLTWSPTLFATQYRVERAFSGYGPWSVLGQTANSLFLDGPSSQAFYRVVALN